MKIEFRIWRQDLTVIAVYASTDDVDSSIKNEFKNNLTITTNSIGQCK